MTRIKRGTIKIKKREALLKRVKGFMWGRKSKARAAKDALHHALRYQYRDRRTKKRVFRRLWQVKLNAALRPHDLSYSKFIHLLKTHSIELNRKILADLAEHEPAVFKQVVEKVKQ